MAYWDSDYGKFVLQRWNLSYRSSSFGKFVLPEFTTNQLKQKVEEREGDRSCREIHYERSSHYEITLLDFYNEVTEPNPKACTELLEICKKGKGVYESVNKPICRYMLERNLRFGMRLIKMNGKILNSWSKFSRRVLVLRETGRVET